MIEMRPYQIKISNAVMDSMQNCKGHTFSVEIARQGGKNELSAHMELSILVSFADIEGNLIKCSPTFKPQTIISMMRLRQRLDDWGLEGEYKNELGYMIKLGRARAIFLSADVQSNVVGNTAHFLLEIDESQDVDKDKYTKEFKPMGATNNVTTVHYGTTWDDSTLLEEVKQSNLELEKMDGVRRHFSYDWREVAKYNPNYARYVEGERQRLGDNHPLFLTQYCLQPIRGGGRFFSDVQRAMLQGVHDRMRSRQPGRVYVAGIDLAGEAEDIPDIMLSSTSTKQDSTVLSVAELIMTDKQPRLEIVEIYSWTGQPHHQLYAQLVSLLRDTWACSRVVVDSTGIGQPVTSFLRKELGSRKAIPFVFTQRSKSDIGFELLAYVNSGRVRVFKGDGSTEYQQFWHQVEKARSLYRPSQTMNFYVDVTEGHDDYLMSLALLVEAAREYRPPRQAKGAIPDERYSI